MMATKQNQQGFSLFMVMIMMIVIALLVVVTSQTTSTESRLSANEADRKYALTEAESALRDAEGLLNKVYDVLVLAKAGAASGVSSGTSLNLMEFKADCTGNVKDSKLTAHQGGLCTAVEASESDVHYEQPSDKNVFKVIGSADKAVYDRKDNNGKSPFDLTTKSLPSDNGKARYVIEYLGQRDNGSGSAVLDYFRITARATGQNENTQVTLQSYVEMAREY